MSLYTGHLPWTIVLLVVETRFIIVTIAIGYLLNSLIILKFLLFLIDLVEIPLLFIGKDTETAICAANNDQVMHCWVTILVVREPVILHLLKFYGFCRGEYSNRYLNSFSSIGFFLTKRSKRLIFLNPCIFRVGCWFNSTSYFVRFLPSIRLLTHAVPKVNLTIFASTNDIFKASFVDTGLNRKILSCMSLVLAPLGIILDIKKSYTGVISSNEKLVSLLT